MQTEKQLMRPVPWPPPSLNNEFPEYTGAWRKVPVVNWFIQSLTKWKHKSDWQDELYRIEEEILNQLKQRKNLEPDYPSQEYKEIVLLLSKAMSKEKPIDPPVILPDDELALLIWGAYDDMTLLEYRVLFYEKYEISLPTEIFKPFLSNLDSRLSLNDFVQTFLDVLANQKSKVSK